MRNGEWWHDFPGAVTVCDAAGIIVGMNDASAAVFARNGGRALVGTSLLDCHPEPSRSMVASMLAEPRINTYTTERQGKWRFLYQAPWYKDGLFAGLVEIMLDIPADLPHHVRD